MATLDEESGRPELCSETPRPRDDPARARLLAAHLVGRNNHMNLIRVLAAVLVICSHSFPLSLGVTAHEPRLPVGTTLGGFAVHVFFALSGSLVTGSLISSGSVTRYAAARILRIFPALVTVVLVCALILGPLTTTLPLRDYLASSETWRYIAWCSTAIYQMAFTLPGVFADLPFSRAVNGSLWTLTWEVRFYVIVAFLFLVARHLPRAAGDPLKWLFTVTWLGCLAGTLVGHADRSAFAPMTLFALNWGVVFFGGACLRVWSERVRLDLWTVLVAVALLIGMSAAGFSYVGYLLVLPYLVLFVALVPKTPLLAYNRLGDFSYGTYLIAFPVQQLIALNVPGVQPATMFAIALPVTLVLAVASWYGIEKPALAVKGRRRARPEQPASDAPIELVR